MKLALPMLTLLVAALAACGEREPVAPDAATPTADVRTADTAAAVAPPAATSTPPAATSGRARFDGYGDLRFGMSAAEAKAAWPALQGTPGADPACFYLSAAGQPSPAHLAFMFVDERLVRYDVGNDQDTAPGGGQRGMDEAAIERLYPGRIERRPHKYVVGGAYLRIADPAGGPGVLLFASDAGGTITGWRVGLPPPVDYVEGCA